MLLHAIGQSSRALQIRSISSNDFDSRPRWQIVPLSSDIVTNALLEGAQTLAVSSGSATVTLAILGCASPAAVALS